MPYSFNPFTGNFDNTPSTLKGDSAYTTVNTISSNVVKTITTITPGISAVTTIVAVSALPPSPDPNTLYIVL